MNKSIYKNRKHVKINLVKDYPATLKEKKNIFAKKEESL